MGIYEKIAEMTAMCIITGFIWGNPVTVCAEEAYRMRYDVPPRERENYTVLTEELGEYEVCEGDSLWRISEKLLGDGAQYTQLVRQNTDVVENPDLIYPKMCLQVARDVYVKKRTGVNGIKTPEYRFGTQEGSRFGILECGEAFANCAMFGNDVSDVICLIRDKEPQGEKALADWNKTQRAIKEYVQKNFASQISDLTFHEYEAADGRKLYLFSYCYKVDGRQYGYDGSMRFYVCEGVCQTDHIQAEFTGFDIEEGIQDIVLYMLASFEELAENGQDDCSVNGYNIQIAPCESWAVSGIHNSFAWIAQYLDAMFSEISRIPEDSTERKPARERILER